MLFHTLAPSKVLQSYHSRRRNESRPPNIYPWKRNPTTCSFVELSTPTPFTALAASAILAAERAGVRMRRVIWIFLMLTLLAGGRGGGHAQVLPRPGQVTSG